MLNKAGVKRIGHQYLQSVNKSENQITSLVVQGGKKYRADQFIDATYEGDLMAASGVSYTIGRESREKYGESLAGTRYPDNPVPVSPYDENGNLLPGIREANPPEPGTGDKHLMVYNIRLNLTSNVDNRVPITNLRV